jgi:hypothetical protein
VKNDFMVDPVPLALTFAKLAIEKGNTQKILSWIFTMDASVYCSGVKIVEDCYVKEILTEKHRAGQHDRVSSVATSQGNIKCDVFINCTGMVQQCAISLLNCIEDRLFF